MVRIKSFFWMPLRTKFHDLQPAQTTELPTQSWPVGTSSSDNQPYRFHCLSNSTFSTDSYVSLG